MHNLYRLDRSKYSTHNIIRNYVGKNNKVLDVGCNDGYLFSISDKSNSFYGLDILRESVKKARKVYKDAIYYDLNNLNSLPWNVKFDVLIFADILEHTVDPEGSLRFFAKNYLRKNGRVIVSLPNIANWQIRLKLLLGEFQYTNTGILDRTHLHFYTQSTAKELMENCGLRVINTLGGASLLGFLFNIFPFSKSLLATSIVVIGIKK